MAEQFAIYTTWVAYELRHVFEGETDVGLTYI